MVKVLALRAWSLGLGAWGLGLGAWGLGLLTISRHFDPLLALGSMNTGTKANIRWRTAKIVEKRYLNPPHYPRKLLLQHKLHPTDNQAQASE